MSTSPVVFEIDRALAASGPDEAADVRERIQAGHVGVVRQFISPDLVGQIRSYLTAIGRNSMPTYQPIEIGRPNFHRLNFDDERAHVRGCFHQFVFYPWNQDVFGLFDLFGDLFRLKNVISGNRADRYLGRSGEDELVSRIAFQFYPAGKGFLNRHQDPFGEHQLAVPTISFSRKPDDFVEGGAFIQDSAGSVMYLDHLTEPGDVVFFDARLTHGVEMIDPGSTAPWLDFVGRWTCLVATNKLAGTTGIQDARDLGTR